MRTYRHVLGDDAVGYLRHDWVRPKPDDTYLYCFVCPASLDLEKRLDEECWASLKKHMRKCKSASHANDFLQALHVTAENLRRRTCGPALPLQNDPNRMVTAQSGLDDVYADEQARR